VLLPALIGCVGPDPVEERPDLGALLRGEMPAQWSSDGSGEGHVAPDGEPQAPFWESFDDPVLTGLVEEALVHNRDLLASAERLRGAAARSMVARSARRPQVQGRLDGARQEQVFVGLPIPGGPLESEYDQWSAAIDLSWELDLWGKLAAGVDAAEAEVQGVLADLEAARLSVAAQVTIAWFGLREATEQVALAEATLATYLRSLKAIEDRHAAGLTGTLDLRLSQANVAGSRAQLAAATRGRDVVARQVEVLLGRFPDAELSSEGAFLKLPPGVPAGVPAEVLSRRPDMVAIERRMAAAEATARQARLDRWPSIALTSSGGLTSEDFKDLLDGDFGVWSLAGRVTAPIFDGGRREARIDESLAVLREIRALFASAALRAFFEVENALAAEGLLIERLGHLEEAALRSREATALAEDQYEQGLVSIDLVLEAQRRELQAESTFLETRRELYQNRVDLHVALGGGFIGDATIAVPAED
jgi:multidrug efflux system outer membrane protein